MVFSSLPSPVTRVKCHQLRFLQTTDHIFARHRLSTISTFLQTVSYQVHITCLWPDFHIGRWRGWQRGFQGKRLPPCQTGHQWGVGYTCGGRDISKCKNVVKMKCIMASVSSHSEIGVPPSVWFRYARRLHCSGFTQWHLFLMISQVFRFTLGFVLQ